VIPRETAGGAWKPAPRGRSAPSVRASRTPEAAGTTGAERVNENEAPGNGDQGATLRRRGVNLLAGRACGQQVVPVEHEVGDAVADGELGEHRQRGAMAEGWSDGS